MYKYAGKTDEELWRGTPEEFELRTRRPITAADLESVLIHTCYPISDVAVLVLFEPHLRSPNFTNDALDYFGMVLTDEDPQVVPFIEEVLRRGYLNVRVRPGTLVHQYLVFMKDQALASRAALWHMLKRHAVAQASGHAPIFEETPVLQDALKRLKAASQ